MSEAQEIQPISPDDVALLLPMSEVIDTINKAIQAAWDGARARVTLDVSISAGQLDEACDRFRAVGWRVDAISTRHLTFARA